MKFKHVLISSDMSKDARLASFHAVHLAQKLGGQVTIAHVDEVSAFGLPHSSALIAHLDRLRGVREEWFASIMEELGGLNVPLKMVDLIGSPARALMDFAKENEVDLIVMGRRGLGKVERFFMGSTTQRMIQHSEIPILIIPHQDTWDEASIKHSKIFVSTDFSQDSRWGIDAAVELAKELDGELVLGHVVDLPIMTGVLGDPTVALPIQTHQQISAAAERDLDALVASIDFQKISKALEIDTDISLALQAMADKNNVDMIVLPTHGKGAWGRFFLGSTTLRVLKIATGPVLVLPRAFLLKNHPA